MLMNYYQIRLTWVFVFTDDGNLQDIHISFDHLNDIPQ